MAGLMMESILESAAQFVSTTEEVLFMQACQAFVLRSVWPARFCFDYHKVTRLVVTSTQLHVPSSALIAMWRGSLCTPASCRLSTWSEH